MGRDSRQKSKTNRYRTNPGVAQSEIGLKKSVTRFTKTTDESDFWRAALTTITGVEQFEIFRNWIKWV